MIIPEEEVRHCTYPEHVGPNPPECGFGANVTKKYGLTPWCKDCCKLYYASPQGRTTQIFKHSRTNATKGKYLPLDKNLYDFILEEVRSGRANKCAVFGCEETDVCCNHCHITGKFICWLCQKHNRAAGILKDDPDNIQALAEAVRNALAATQNQENFTWEI